LKIKLSIICTQQNNGSYVAICPDLKACFTQGDTYEQAILQIEDLIQATIKEDLSNEELHHFAQNKRKIFTEYEAVV
jgi:predicted RNase H-like HicB family nuclease